MVLSLCERLREPDDPSRAELRARLWVLLRDALGLALRRESARFRGVTREDLEDLASTKALEILSRLERGEWETAGRAPGEVVSYLRSTARHGLLHLARQRGRLVPTDGFVPDSGEEDEDEPMWSAPISTPEREAESREFAAGLVECLGRLQPRARFVWFLRAVHDLGSRDIASHPEVRASVANVDVILMRVRAQLRDCLGARGFEPGPLPPGTFGQVWSQIARRAPGLVAEPGRSES